MTMRLYWVITEDHHEDWFIVARSHEEAEVFHEQNEGYLPGDAMAEEIIAIPDEIVTETGWPSEQVLLAGYCEQQSLSPRQSEVCAHIGTCRTEALDGV